LAIAPKLTSVNRKELEDFLQKCIFNFHIQHQFLKNLPAAFVSLNILSSEIISLKSVISSSEVFRVTMHGMPALLAASTPKGEFSTTTASDGFSVPNLYNAA